MDDLVSQLRGLLARRADVAFAVLFGSAATGKLRPASDVDLAIRFTVAPGPWELGGLIDELTLGVGRQVDIVALNTLRSTVLTREIGKGTLVLGNEEELIELRCRGMREWRDYGPRFHRLSKAMFTRLAQSRDKGEPR